LIIDLHAHTAPLSDDSILAPDELIVRTKRAGFDGICLTEHDWFWDPAKVATLSKRHHFPVFAGCEITTEEGHLLVFGLERYVFGMHHSHFVRHMVDERGGAIIVAHPYRRHYRSEIEMRYIDYDPVERACANPMFALVDGIEVCNGRGTEEENAFAAEVGRRLNLHTTGGSDSHELVDIGRSATEFERGVDSIEDLIRELRHGRFRALA
jgi:predicted metal-dependent phosphoesterase TrpH